MSRKPDDIKPEPNPVGRPPMFSNAEDMGILIDEYFDKCKADKETKTIAGLALACGFISRESIYEYEKKPEFTYTIKRARLRIESEAEARLTTGNCTGTIFWLKNNAGYKDRQEIDANVSGELIIQVVKFADNQTTE